MNSLLLAMRVARYTPRSVTRGGAWAGANVGWLRKGKSRIRLEENLHRVTGLSGRELSRLSRQGMISAARYYAEVLEMPRITERTGRRSLSPRQPGARHLPHPRGQRRRGGAEPQRQLGFGWLRRDPAHRAGDVGGGDAQAARAVRAVRRDARERRHSHLRTRRPLDLSGAASRGDVVRRSASLRLSAIAT